MDNIALLSLKEVTDDLQIEYEILPVTNIPLSQSKNQEMIQNSIQSIDNKLNLLDIKLSELNNDIDKLINHSDGIDYITAVGSGILAGLIDILFVGEFSLDSANEWGNKKTEEFVIKVAKITKNNQGKSYTGNSLQGAVKFLEENFEIAADKVTSSFGGGLQHHLRDFSHHPTIIGLFFSMLTQFTECVYGTDITGKFTIVPLKKDNLTLVGKNIPEKISFGLIKWIFHLISDVAGSSGSIYKGSKGTGIPGPILATVKEISSLPIFKKENENGYKELSVTISKLFNGTLLGDRDENGNILKAKPFDFRTELGLGMEITKQSMPIILNECVVRSIYFIRRLYCEIKNSNIVSFKDLEKIKWKNTLPFKNRTITRMLTISMGTFCAIDLTDASIRAAIKSGGNPITFVSNMILRVNFIGLGRLSISIGTELGMGLKKDKKEKEKNEILSEYFQLTDTKLYYKETNLKYIEAELYEKEANLYSIEEEIWQEIKLSNEAVKQLYIQMINTCHIYSKYTVEMNQHLNDIKTLIPNIEKNNPGLKEKMLERLK